MPSTHAGKHAPTCATYRHASSRSRAAGRGTRAGADAVETAESAASEPEFLSSVLSTAGYAERPASVPAAALPGASARTCACSLRSAPCGGRLALLRGHRARSYAHAARDNCRQPTATSTRSQARRKPAQRTPTPRTRNKNQETPRLLWVGSYLALRLALGARNCDGEQPGNEPNQPRSLHAPHAAQRDFARGARAHHSVTG